MVCVCAQIILTVLYVDLVVFFGHVCSPALRIKDLRYIVEELCYIMLCFLLLDGVKEKCETTPSLYIGN